MDTSRRTFLKGMFGAAVCLAIPSVPKANIVIPKPEPIIDAVEHLSDHMMDSMSYLSVDDLYQRAIRKAAQKLADEIDNYVFEKIMESGKCQRNLLRSNTLDENLRKWHE